MKYTPGPWDVDKYTPGDKWLDIFDAGARVDIDDFDEDGRAEQFGNALLISKAPTMYEALREIHESLQFMLDSDLEQDGALHTYILKLMRFVNPALEGL